MLQPREITENIYESKVLFTKFVSFVKQLAIKEKEKEKESLRFHISLKNFKGDSFEFSSAEEAFCKTNPHNLSELKTDKITEISLSSSGQFKFRFYLFSNGRAVIIRTHADQFGVSIKELMLDSLSLNTKKSKIVSIIDNKLFGFLGSIPIFLIYLQVEDVNSLSFPLMVLAATLHFMLCFAPLKYEKTNKIIMGNSEDPFLTRNMDSIILSTIFTIIGGILGFITGYLLAQ